MMPCRAAAKCIHYLLSKQKENIMPKCKQCGFDFEGNARFCPNCATRVDAPPAEVFTGTISSTSTVVVQQADASADLEPGKEFHGRYSMERKLGQGAMGAVYLALDRLTAGRVALKLIHPLLTTSASARERFLREGLIARDIRHKNVVAVYDVSETDGQYYIVMEYLSGETLRSWLHRSLQADKDIPYETAEQIIRSILDGLDAAHVKGVVHRDVKPENIMVTGNPEAGDYSLKILDFGIARAIASSAVVTTTTSTGTVLYMAPEQKTAADTVGPPADLYAVTAIFYELLLGVAPGGRWTPLSLERKDLPAGIDILIDKGLSSRPRSRYQNVQEYREALKEVHTPPRIVPLPSPAPQPSVPPVVPVAKQGARMSKRTVLLGAVVILGFVIVGTYLATDNFGPGRRPVSQLQQQPQTQEQPRSREREQAQSTPRENPPLHASYADLQGTWYDELAGAGIALVHVVIRQNGTAVSGPILDAQGIMWGTFSGRVTGNILEYNYYSSFGNGWGRGQLDPDGNHMQVLVNGRERHILHRNHLPPD
jgi:serine/threonine protein kinase